jgi:hypothetical protein
MIDSPYFTRIVFALIYVPFFIIMGEVIHRKGRLLISYIFGAENRVGSAISDLFHIGWYVLAFGLLLWTFGIGFRFRPVPDEVTSVHFLEAQLNDILVRLGVCVFVLGSIHSLNLLAISLFHRKSKA